MATYAIGDIQGCLPALERLLDRLNFDPARDQLWFTGDLVNRGPDSLGTLRFIRALGKAALAVLGNHDLHLLAVAHTGAKQGRHDTLDAILAAPDRAELLDWLAHRPLLHHDAQRDWTLIHAGLPPQWDLELAATLAREVETTLRGPRLKDFLAVMYANEPDRWSPALAGDARLRFTVNCLTRLRFCTPQGRLLFKPKGAPGSQPSDSLPWFEAPGRRSAGHRIVFGHWAALGRIEWPGTDVYGIDTGCVWGNALSALCLETGTITSCGCADMAHESMSRGC